MTPWLAIGVTIGIGMHVKTLVAVLTVALVVGLLASPRRRVLATWHFGLAVAIALAIAAPTIWWQATHGRPQLEMGRAIATGSSGTSDGPIEFVLLQLGLVGPLVVPVWLIGFRVLWRDGRREVPIAYALLFVVFLITGGKAYYLAGMYPALLAAGAVTIASWAADHRRLAGTWLATDLATAAFLFLPLVPASLLDRTPIPAVNYDAGETVGWPELVAAVTAAHDRLPAAERGRAVILTRNYGQASAVERFGRDRDLPRPVSGHNAYWWWGPPTDDADVVIIVGIPDAERDRLFSRCEPAGRVDNRASVDNDEQGTRIDLCRAPRAS